MYGDELVHRHDHDVNQFCSGKYMVGEVSLASLQERVHDLLTAQLYGAGTSCIERFLVRNGPMLEGCELV